MKTIAQISRKVRTYAIDDAKRVLTNVKDTKLKVDVGLWLSGDKNANETEIETLFELTKLYGPKISSIIVGNEVLLRADLSYSTNLRYQTATKTNSSIQRTKTASRQFTAPVS